MNPPWLIMATAYKRASPRRAARSPRVAKRKESSEQTTTFSWLAVAARVFTFRGFAGSTKGSFFQTPDWVDKRKAPGTTSQSIAYAKSPDWWMPMMTGYSLLFSPNLIWLLIALAEYWLCPYDLEAAARGIAASWVSRRLAVNLFITFSYVLFWHVSLYWLGWGTRPFRENRQWRWSKVLHNAFYNVLAAAQWTGFEVVLMLSWSSGKLPYLSDEAAFGTGDGFLNFVASLFWVPLWRTWHFYFAHRLLHVRPLYKYVHSLHHRNTDVEPFAGLCMHPVEHLYYFACVMPTLFLFASPFAAMWNGVHLLISPAASHSGYEDHFQSDQFHYLHHRYFECNYGPTDCPLDQWFGTFRDRMPPAAPAVGRATRASSSEEGGGCGEVIDPKASLRGAPEGSFVAYMVLAIVCPFCALAHALHSASHPEYLEAVWHIGPLTGAQSVAALVSLGPVVVAMCFLLLSDSAAVSRDPRRALLGPFQAGRITGWLGFHLLMGAAMTILPVYCGVHTALAPVGNSAYCRIHGCP